MNVIAPECYRCSMQPEIFTHQSLPEPVFELRSTVGESSVLTATLGSVWDWTSQSEPDI